MNIGKDERIATRIGIVQTLGQFPEVALPERPALFETMAELLDHAGLAEIAGQTRQLAESDRKNSLSGQQVDEHNRRIVQWLNESSKPGIQN